MFPNSTIALLIGAIVLCCLELTIGFIGIGLGTQRLKFDSTEVPPVEKDFLIPAVRYEAQNIKIWYM
jgi:hypothetical protein